MSGSWVNRLSASMAALCIGGLALLTGNLGASDCGCEPCASCADFSEPVSYYQHVPYEYRYEAGIYRRDLGPAVHDFAMAHRSDYRDEFFASDRFTVRDWGGTLRSTGAPDVAVGNAPAYDRDVRLDIEPALTMQQRPDLEPQAGIETSVQRVEEPRNPGIWYDGRFYPSRRPRFDNSIGIRSGAVGAEEPEAVAPVDAGFRSETGVVDERGNLEPLSSDRVRGDVGVVGPEGASVIRGDGVNNNVGVIDREGASVPRNGVNSNTAVIDRDGANFQGDRVPAAGPSGDTIAVPPAIDAGTRTGGRAGSSDSGNFPPTSDNPSGVRGAQ
jgi:hypothetical protein